MTSDGQHTRFDFERERRIGLAEAVFAEGKTPEQLTATIADCGARDTPLLITRLSPAAYDSISPAARDSLDFDPLSNTAISGPISEPTSERVAVVTAGTVDLAPAREAIRTLAFHGESAQLFADVGVAGLWRLLDCKDAIAKYPVVIALAGMEGALFSVLAGLVPGLVIAVPTSNGYGVAEKGRAALHAALSSCAPGVTVTNIDNGYGAACAALRALRMCSPDAS